MTDNGDGFQKFIQRQTAKDIVELLVAAEAYADAGHAYMNANSSEMNEENFKSSPIYLDLWESLAQLCYIAKLTADRYLIIEEHMEGPEGYEDG